MKIALRELYAAGVSARKEMITAEADYARAEAELRVVDDAAPANFPLAPQALETAAAAGAVREESLAGLGPTVLGLRTLSGPFRGYLVATVPSAQAFSSLREGRKGLILTGAATAFMIVILNFVGARALLRPILLLSEGAKRVAGGDLDIYLPVRGHDEIADLTRAFNDMAHRIREGRQSLESARDALAQANAGLRDANRTLETLAITDGLTGLYNRRHFQDTFESEIRRSGRSSPSASRIGRLSHASPRASPGQLPSLSPPSTIRSIDARRASSGPRMRTL